jgi:hypothetical protein
MSISINLKILPSKEGSIEGSIPINCYVKRTGIALCAIYDYKVVNLLLRLLRNQNMGKGFRPSYA